MSDYKRCSKCKNTYPTSQFYNDKSRSDKKAMHCKICCFEYREKDRKKRRIYMAQYREIHRDEILRKKRIDGKKYYQENRQKIRERQRKNFRPEMAQKKQSIRRARKHKNGVFSVTTKEIKKIRMQQCFYCGGAGGTLDHIIPVSRGGRHSIGNLVGACLTCNLQKGTKLISEWKKVRGW